PGVAEARTAEAILRRYPAGLVLAPPGHRLSRAQVAPPGTEVRTGGLLVRVEHAEDRLAATVTTAPPALGATAARGPPG
ncbi:MAG: hypothetical protein LC733_10495, partial [Actinobacteria bacterium]|nr:hypothetical protein [Actinomycetota bacterium]